MTESTSEETQTNVIERTLSNGKILRLDLSKNNGHLLMKARKDSGGSATVIYMIAELGTFDGEKLPAPEILNWSAFDIVELETLWGELAEKK